MAWLQARCLFREFLRDSVPLGRPENSGMVSVSIPGPLKCFGQCDKGRRVIEEGFVSLNITPGIRDQRLRVEQQMLEQLEVIAIRAGWYEALAERQKRAHGGCHNGVWIVRRLRFRVVETIVSGEEVAVYDVADEGG